MSSHGLVTPEAFAAAATPATGLAVPAGDEASVGVRKLRVVSDPAEWSSAESAELYGVHNWGAGYFDINETGEVILRAPADGKVVTVSLMEIIAGMRQRDLQMPVLLRLDNVLEAQVALLYDGFAKAIQENGYQSQYRGVFPIKVNQQRSVIEEMVRVGAWYGHGLEAGSKAELLIALAHLEPENGYIVCNGYKDEEFIDLALQSMRLGFKCLIVVETPTELPMILESSKRVGVRPMLGVRVKLAARVQGHWNESSGDRSIFGLTTAQIVELIDELRNYEMLDCLQLLHYHLGSQIPNILDIRGGIEEACRYYVALRQEGAPLGYLDLGGGLGVDYDGSRTNSNNSTNYSLDEYCTEVIQTIISTLGPAGVPHPTIITESGRATVAYSSILLFNILDVTTFEPADAPPTVPEDGHELVKNLREVLNGITAKTAKEAFSAASYYREEIRQLFRRGQIRLRLLSLAENIFLHVVRVIVRVLQKVDHVPAGFEGLEETLADIYYGNFSVFQSLPDVWAIDQVFPIIPVHRHNEEPTRRAILADITCDSDGKIDKFIESGGLKRTLPVHAWNEKQDYYFGVFLVGAYQETLGDLHNLMGDTNVASVRVHGDGTFEFVREMSGDSISDVLSYVEHDPQRVLEQLHRTAEDAVRNQRITLAQRRELLESVAASLRGYTYHEGAGTSRAC
ncbi:Biosynthetic arginine decarboxylase [Mycobacterium simulans]|uniref:Arginine decarboxylase n=1 Tax=Mycobacterium simulans TaxID=627089 RepID=A0A7Z7IPP1_9MYCO|nr:Biosynthetic arginine decarboxylase [Mycobacterium simulans]